MKCEDKRIQPLMQIYRMNSAGMSLSNLSMITEPKPIRSEFCFNPPTSNFVSAGVTFHSDLETPIPNESSNDGLDSSVDDILDGVINGDKSSHDDSDPINNRRPLKYCYYRSIPQDIIVMECSEKCPRIFKKGFICTLNKGFGFFKTIAQDEEIFFQSSSLVGDFSALELGQAVKYVESETKPQYGRTAVDVIKPLPKGSISRAAVFPEIISDGVSRPLRSANPDQTEYKGYIDGNDGHGDPSGIISMLNKKKKLQADESQLDVQEKPVKIRSEPKKLRATVKTVMVKHGFLSYELEEGKNLFFHMREVKDHQQLNPGDEVEFVIGPNPENRKPSACSIWKLGKTQRPERLLNLGKRNPLDETAIRQPYGPDGTRGFSYRRIPRVPGQLNSNSTH